VARAGTAYIDFEGRFDKLTRQTDGAVRGVERRFDGLSRSLSRSLGGAARAVGQTVATGLSVGVGAATALGGAAVVAGANYNTLGQKATAAMRTVTGSSEAATQMMGDLMAFASESPFPRQAFIEATQQMMAFGFAAEDVIPTLSAVQDAVAAAGGGAQQISEVTFILSQIQAAGKITGQDLMQLGQRGINAADLIGQSLGKTGTQVRADITAGALDAETAIKALTDGMTADFAGAAANLKGTWSGAIDSINARVRDLGAAFVEPFIGFAGGGALVEGLGKISDALKGLVVTGEDGSVRFAGALAPLNDILARWGDRLLGLFDAAAKLIGGLDLSGVTGMFRDLGPAIGAVGGAIGAGLGGQLPVIGQFLSGINPVVAAIGGLVATSPELRETFGTAFADVFATVQPLIEPVLGVLTSLGQTVLPPLAAAFTGLVEAAAPIVVLLADIAGEVLDALGPVLEDLGGIVADIAEVLGDALLGVLDAIAPVLPELAEAFGTIATVLGGALLTVVEALAPILPDIAEAFGELAVVLGDALLQVVEAIAPYLPELADAFAELVRAALPLVDALIPLVPVVVDILVAFTPLIPVVTKLIGWLADLVGVVARCKPLLFALVGIFLALNAPVVLMVGAIGLLVANWDKVWNALKAGFDWIKRNWPLLVAILVGPFGVAVLAIVRNFDKIKAAASAVWQFIQDVFAKLRDWVVGAVAAVGRAIGGFATAVWSWVSGAVGRAAGALGRIAGAIWGWISGTATGIATRVAGFATAVWSWVSGAVGRAAGVLARIGGAMWGWVSGMASGIATRVAGWAGKVWSWVSGAVGRAAGALGRIATALWNWAAGVARSIGGEVAGWAGAIWSWVAGAVEASAGKLGAIWTALKSWITGVADKVVGLAKDIGSAIWTGIKEGIGDLASKLGDLVSGAAEKIKGGGVPFIPGIQRGGLVRRPMLAMVGEAGPELVLPLNDPARMQALLARFAPVRPVSGAAAGVATRAAAEAVAPTAPTDISGIDAWATAVTARLALLPDEIAAAMAPGMVRWREAVRLTLAAITADLAAALARWAAQLRAWVAATTATLTAALARWTTLARTWANVTLFAVTIPALRRWSATFQAIVRALVTFWHTQLATMARTAASTVNGISSTFRGAIATWRTLGARAAGEYTSAITSRLTTARTSIGNIVAGYATKLANGLNPILKAVGQRQIRLADGGVVTFARGGLHERHIAQIARPGTFRVWAEPETGGEAYIPLARSKRRRSRAIAGETVSRLGGDVAWYRGGAVTGNTAGLNPTFLQRVTTWAMALGKTFHVGSGYRSIASQQVLYAKYLAGRGNLAAKPGSSMHNFGLAIDGPHWGGYSPGTYGLVYRVRGEPWHVEPVEARAWRGKTPAAGWGDQPGVAFAELPKPPAVGRAGAMADTARHAMRFVYDKALEWSSKQLATAASAAPAPVGGGRFPPLVERWRPTVLRALQMTGQAATWADAILNRIKFESGGDPNAVNRWDVNWRRGDPSGGLMQNIGSAYASRVARFPQLRGTNYLHPLGSLVAAIVYTLDRNGSLSIHANPSKGYGRGGIVFAHAHDFDNGGVLRPGMNLVENATGRDEELRPVARRRQPAVTIGEAHFHEGVDYDAFLRKTAFMVAAGRL
jgi:tape measure domain-containing protein